MKTVSHKHISGESKSLIVTLAVIFCVGCIGFAIHMSKVNQRLEVDLREERLRGERLLSEKLSLEKELEEARKAVEDLGKQMNIVGQQPNNSQVTEVKKDNNKK